MVYEECLTQSQCPINICRRVPKGKGTFLIHYKALTQTHPHLAFDSISSSFSKFCFIHPLTCSPLYIRNDLIKTLNLIISKSLEIFWFLPISLRMMAKIFPGACLLPPLSLHLPPWFSSLSVSTTSTHRSFILALPSPPDLCTHSFRWTEHSSFPSWPSKPLLIL